MFTINYTRAFALPLTILGLVIGLSHPAAADTWQPVYSARGGFAAQMPSTPQETAKPVTTGMGRVVAHTTAAESQGGREAFMVMYSDFPTDANLGTTEKVLADVRHGYVTDGGAQILREGPTSNQGRPGRYYVGTLKDGQSFACRAFLDGRRLYQIIYVSADGQISQAANTFLNSFRITR